jgi:hypothetical protein
MILISPAVAIAASLLPGGEARFVTQKFFLAYEDRERFLERP